ncbi:MAG: PIN domain-containing protein [Actinomycetia bacterium]|nr:PIN domain-containing protein [Actinomycetes bacterium]
MARVIRLDTHAVVWLYTGEIERFTQYGQELLESEQLTVSPIVQLELTYLHEIGRLKVGGADIVGDLESRIRLYTVNQPLLAVVQAAASLSWTRDPFDRLIVGDALAANCPLLTKDEAIHAGAPLAVW